MDRIWNRVRKTKSCWLWVGEVSWNGYGRLQINKRRISAHRYFYELLAGVVPEGMELDHLCRVKNCVNPNHLEVVTHSENVRRAWKVRIDNSPSCPNGHEYNEKNLYVAYDKKNGKKWRMCRKCRAINQGKYRKNKVIQ